MDTKLYILTGNIVSRTAGCVDDTCYLEQACPARGGLSMKWSQRSENKGSLYGDDCIRDTPVPIPNTEVKPYNADGTAWATLW